MLFWALSGSSSVLTSPLLGDYARHQMHKSIFQPLEAVEVSRSHGFAIPLRSASIDGALGGYTEGGCHMHRKGEQAIICHMECNGGLRDGEHSDVQQSYVRSTEVRVTPEATGLCSAYIKQSQKTIY